RGDQAHRFGVDSDGSRREHAFGEIFFVEIDSHSLKMLRDWARFSQWADALAGCPISTIRELRDDGSSRSHAGRAAGLAGCAWPGAGDARVAATGRLAEGRGSGRKDHLSSPRITTARAGIDPAGRSARGDSGPGPLSRPRPGAWTGV